MVKVAFAVSAPVDCVPLGASAPDQPPEAVQPVALVELQVSIEELPLVTLVGFALSVAVGTGSTVTVADTLALVPPAPVQSIVNVLSAVSAPVDCVPFAPSAPVQPPEAMQPVALVELHVSMEALPRMTLVGFALNIAVGAGGFSIVAAPPLQPFSSSAQASTPIRESERERIRIDIEQLNPDYVDCYAGPHLRELEGFTE
jgi:hypothetical protein